tara:strand:- start:2635 stop:3861 length:1227 start_codon:yes stop_codon:yes gene_type:complete
MSLALPTLFCGIRFDAGAENDGWILGSASFPNQLGSPDADSDYVDVTSYVRSISIDRGKSRELQRTAIGRVSIVLDNTTRLFDPLNASGTYYGKLLPSRRVRIKLTHPTTGTQYEVFEGIVTDWGMGYEQMKDATTTVRVSDRMVDLRRADISLTTTAGVSSVAVNDILDEAGIVARDVATGLSTLQATALTGSTLSALEKVEDSEGIGQVYASKSNAVVYKNRNSFFSDTASNTSQATLGTVALPLTDVSLDYDADLIRNDISLTRAGGSAQTTSNADSINDYGKRSYTKTDLMNSTDAELSTIAGTLLSIYKEPRVRVRTVTMAPQVNANLMTQALTRNLRDRVTVNFSPPGGGSAISQDGYIVGIHHRITPDGQMETAFDLESTEGFDTAFVLGSAKLGTAELWA